MDDEDGTEKLYEDMVAGRQLDERIFLTKIFLDDIEK